MIGADGDQRLQIVVGPQFSGGLAGLDRGKRLPNRLRLPWTYRSKAAHSPRSGRTRDRVQDDQREGAGGVGLIFEDVGPIGHRRRVHARRQAGNEMLLRAVHRGELSPDSDLELAQDLLRGVILDQDFPPGYAERRTDAVLRSLGAKSPDRS